MTHWEYRVIQIEGNFGAGGLDKPSEILTKHLNMMGKEGWELAALAPSVYRRNPEAHCRELIAALLCFKRAVRSAAGS